MFLPKLTTDLFGTNGFTTPLSFQTLYQNRPFPGPSSPGPLFQNEGRCSAFDMGITFHSHANNTHFHKKGCAPGLILKVRVFGTRKWPIDFLFSKKFSCTRIVFIVLACPHVFVLKQEWIASNYSGAKIFLCSFELNCLIRKFVLTSNSFASCFNNSEPLRPVESFYASSFGFGKSSRTNFVLT